VARATRGFFVLPGPDVPAPNGPQAPKSSSPVMQLPPGRLQLRAGDLQLRAGGAAIAAMTQAIDLLGKTLVVQLRGPVAARNGW